MLEITDPARQLIRSAFRRGRVLVIEAPWRGYAGTISLVARWIGAADDRELTDHVRIGDGDWIYLRSDLTPLVRRERIVLERHSILGLWPGIAVRTLEPVPIPVERDPTH
jgi:hypothetical protein